MTPSGLPVRAALLPVPLVKQVQPVRAALLVKQVQPVRAALLAKVALLLVPQARKQAQAAWLLAPAESVAARVAWVAAAKAPRPNAALPFNPAPVVLSVSL